MKVPVVTMKKCKAAAVAVKARLESQGRDASHVRVTHAQICAGGQKGRDSCHVRRGEGIDNFIFHVILVTE